MESGSRVLGVNHFHHSVACRKLWAVLEPITRDSNRIANLNSQDLEESEMRQITFVLVLFGLAPFLAGCGGKPPQQESMNFKKQINKPDEGLLFEAVDLDYWIDGETSKPSLAIVSLRISVAPVTQQFGISAHFGDEPGNYVRISQGKSGWKEIPYPENDLISAGQLPVYYAVKKDEICKAVLTSDEFAQLRAAIENEDFSGAKKIVTENAEEQPLG